MDRKEFISTIWTKKIKPTIILLFLIYLCYFLYKAFSENNNERAVLFLIISIPLIILLIYLIKFILNNLKKRVETKLTYRIKFLLSSLRSTVELILSLAFGALLYHFWMTDFNKFKELIFVLTFLWIISTISEFRKRKKNGTEMQN
jgi:uncharacterized membrane protein YbjE (DUF340 family)